MEVEKEGGCQIMGTFGMMVQLLLGFLSFLVLIIKRQIEKPKRLWKIFLMDSTKQLFSQLLTHFLNVALAIFISKNEKGDACIWYFITYIIDTTAGVGLCFIILSGAEKIFEVRNMHKFKTGNYYTIQYPNLTTFAVSSENVNHVKKAKAKAIIDYPSYVVQLLLWMLIVLISKIVLYYVQIWFAGFFQDLAEFIFQPVSDKPEFELVIIMILIPFVMNAFCFWVQDGFLKKTQIKREERDLLMGVIYENEPNPEITPEEYAVYIGFQQHPNHQVPEPTEKIIIELDEPIRNKETTVDSTDSLKNNENNE